MSSLAGKQSKNKLNCRSEKGERRRGKKKIRDIMCVCVPFLHISLALSPPLDSPASKMNTNGPSKDREEVGNEGGTGRKWSE